MLWDGRGEGAAGGGAVVGTVYSVQAGLMGCLVGYAGECGGEVKLKLEERRAGRAERPDFSP